LDFIKNRDNAWQKFMSEMREQQDKILKEMADEIRHLSEMFMKHDREMNSAIGVMKDREKRGKSVSVSKE